MVHLSLTVACLLTGLAGGGQSAATLLRSVRVEATSAGAATIVIEADGPLPQPHVGVLAGPPRIFLDFADVTPTTRGSRDKADGLVQRVRVALHQLNPLTTRVVIDLSGPLSHTLDARHREAGLIRVVLGPAAPPAPEVDKTGIDAPRAARPAKPSAADADRKMLLGVLSQLGRLRQLLSSIDARAQMSEDTLRAAFVEFDAISQLMASSTVDPRHEDVMKICSLGKTAASARLDAQQRGDEKLSWNAASAAAGALILLDRLASELKTQPTIKP